MIKSSGLIVATNSLAGNKVRVRHLKIHIFQPLLWSRSPPQSLIRPGSWGRHILEFFGSEFIVRKSHPMPDAGTIEFGY